MEHEDRFGVIPFAEAEPENEGIYYGENEDCGGDVAKTVIKTGRDEDGQEDGAVAEEVDEPAGKSTSLRLCLVL